MPTFVVKKIFQYSEEVTVEAGSAKEAKDKAMEMDGERNHDDSLMDCEIVSESEGD